MLFFLVVHYLVVPQLGGVRASLTAMSRLNPLLVLAAVLAEVASLVAYAQMARTLLPADDRPSLPAVFRVQLATLGASHLLPGGGATSAPIGFRMFRRLGVSGSNAGFVLAIQPIASAAVLNVMLLTGLLLSIPLRGASAGHLATSLVGLLVVTVFGLVVFAVYRGTELADRGVHAIARFVPRVDADALSRLLWGLADRLRLFTADRRVLARAVGWAAAQWIADAASLWIFLAALGVHAPFDGLLIAFALASVSAVIPLTPGGVGVYEGILTSSLIGFGIPKASAIIGVLIYRLVEFWLPIPVGVAAYLSAELSDPDPDGQVADDQVTADQVTEDQVVADDDLPAQVVHR